MLLGKGNFLSLIKDGLRNIWLNSLMSLASVGVLTACLLLVGSAFLVYFNIESGLDQVGSLGEIKIFLTDDLSETEKSAIEDTLTGLPEIYDIQYISREQAAIDLQSQLTNGEELFAVLEGDNYLPDSFLVKVRDSENYNMMVERLSQIIGVDEIAANGTIANTLNRISRAVALFGSITVGVLLVISMFILSNAVKLAMFSRRKEISIMKLVGATNSFVRIPFFVEGVLLGLISAIIAFAIVWVGYVNITGTLSDLSFLFVMVDWKVLAPIIALLFGGMGFFAGAFSSLISIKKYLKV